MACVHTQPHYIPLRLCARSSPRLSLSLYLSLPLRRQLFAATLPPSSALLAQILLRHFLDVYTESSARGGSSITLQSQIRGIYLRAPSNTARCKRARICVCVVYIMRIDDLCDRDPHAREALHIYMYVYARDSLVEKRLLPTAAARLGPMHLLDLCICHGIQWP